MKISDFIFQFGTEPGAKQRGVCRVRTFATNERRAAVVMTDLTGVGLGSKGPSVTNSVEFIREALIDKGFMTHQAMLIEHYEKSSYREATFDVVCFSSANIPSWKPIDIASICSLLDCNTTEFEIDTENDARLLAQIEMVRNSIDSFAGSPNEEGPEVVNRRADIEAGMLSKKRLAEVVASQAGENELQRLLQSDLSILAEVYSTSEDEYICFSEFPVGNGFVDFAVFSGRSRMDVTLIEIKGADFHLTTSGSYKNFSHKVNEAIQQIRTRIGVVYRDMETFRRSVHSIRQRIESGASIHGSFAGPYHRLEVDPNKDINIRCVVIAGRTKNDLEESRQRHDYEWSIKPPVRVETWDTWLRKLRRL